MITKNKITSVKKDMLAFRQKITVLNDPELNLLTESNGFYSTSELRDLLFHVQEHRFTILQVSKIIDDLGLVFMGFEFADVKKILKKFGEIHPKSTSKYELEKWHDYELLNPNIFAGMYQFWCQKP